MISEPDKRAGQHTNALQPMNKTIAADTISDKERTFSSLQNKVFRVIWAAITFSHLGGVIQITAAAWLMTTLTTSTTLIALVQSAAALPVMLFALLAGATADIHDKRSQMIVAAAFSGAAVLMLVLLYEMGLLGPWSLLFLTGMLGVSGAFYSPAWQASLPEIVSDEHFVSAISVNNLSMNVARSMGPAIAAEILIRFGVSAAFLANGATYLLLIAALFLWKREPKASKLPRETILRAIGDGLRYAAISPAIWITLLRAFSFTLGSSAVLALPPVIVLTLGGDARSLGVLLVGFGTGAVCGALSLTWARATTSVDNIAFLSSVMMAISMAVLGLSEKLWLLTVMLFLAGFFWVQIVSLLQISIQTSCPRWVAGRMVSMLAMTYSAGIAAGSAIWGVLAEMWSLSAALYCASGAMLTAGFLMRLLPFDPPIQSDLEPHNKDAVEDTKPLDLMVGPVVIEVEYEIDRDNVAEFMEVIFDLRRIRVRDGARRWRLTQDIENNALWVEQFESPTWAAYLQRVSRRLVGDIPVHNALVRLCRKPPTWRQRLERTARAEPLDIVWPKEPSA